VRVRVCVVSINARGHASRKKYATDTDCERGLPQTLSHTPHPSHTHTQHAPGDASRQYARRHVPHRASTQGRCSLPAALHLPTPFPSPTNACVRADGACSRICLPPADRNTVMAACVELTDGGRGGEEGGGARTRGNVRSLCVCVCVCVCVQVAGKEGPASSPKCRRVRTQRHFVDDGGAPLHQVLHVHILPAAVLGELHQGPHVIVCQDHPR
jgi:hypothetical protein